MQNKDFIRPLSDYELFYAQVEQAAPLNIVGTITLYKPVFVDKLKEAIKLILKNEVLVFARIYENAFYENSKAFLKIQYYLHAGISKELLCKLSSYKFTENSIRFDLITDKKKFVNALILTCAHSISDASSILNPFLQKLTDILNNKYQMEQPQIPAPLEVFLPKENGKFYTNDYSKLKLLSNIPLDKCATDHIILNLNINYLRARAKILKVSFISVLNAKISKAFYASTDIDAFLYQHVINVRLSQTRDNMKIFAARPSFCQHGMSITHPIFGIQDKSVEDLAVEFDKLTKHPFDYFSYDDFASYLKLKNKEMKNGFIDVHNKFPSICFSNIGTVKHASAKKVIKEINILGSCHVFSRTRFNAFVCYVIYDNYVSISLHFEKNALTADELQTIASLIDN